VPRQLKPNFIMRKKTASRFSREAVRHCPV